MPLNFLYLLFFLSGIPALFYQLAWQRSLFDIFGINIEATTTVVSAFMLGLGLGSLLGGWLSNRIKKRALYLFAATELLIGIFGYQSLHLFAWANHYTLNIPLTQTFLVTLGLIGLPTLLMGATLPLLVSHLLKRYPNIGYNVGGLYFVNTLGSGIACLIAAHWAMGHLGLTGVIHLAASLNILVGVGALLFAQAINPVAFNNKSDLYISAQINSANKTVPFIIGLLIVLLAGYLALSYEIILIRIYSFLTASHAYAFAVVLGFYLIGLAYGGYYVRFSCTRLQTNIPKLLINIILLSSLAGYFILPAIATIATHTGILITVVLISILSALSGSILPLLSHLLVKPDAQAGARIGGIYFANIIGSALGSFITGFILFDLFGIEKIILLLSISGLVLFIITSAVFAEKYLQKILIGLCLAIIMWLLAPVLFSHFYEKLYYKQTYSIRPSFTKVIENKEGVITVTPHGMVLGHGAYDCYFNTSLQHDINWISRAYLISALHPHPNNVLMIGLSSGSWAQVIANNPDVHKLTVIEINPGYLKLIPDYPEVASLLKNPKVNIIIDDGRRWLKNHPANKFDIIVMNTTWNWREYASNVLSVDFMQLARKHLAPYGIVYYNTTFSERALYTGLSSFPYGIRYIDMIALSDYPIDLSKQRLQKTLHNYVIDNQPALVLTKASDKKIYNHLTSLVDKAKTSQAVDVLGLEYKASLIKRIKPHKLITDDNMGNEWP